MGGHFSANQIRDFGIGFKAFDMIIEYFKKQPLEFKKMNQRQQIEQQLIEKAMKDESFRKQLIENPGAAIETELGMKIPVTMNIKVLEEDPKTFFLVLPYTLPNNPELELTEAELKSVAGGTELNPENAWSSLCIF
jgi:hypothetical protein